MGPHDGRYKLFFSYRSMMADLLRGLLREPWLDELDLETLEPASASFVDHRRREKQDFPQKHADCIWRARIRGGDGAWTDCYILLEFQTKPERYMPLRLLGYESLLLERLVRERQMAAHGVLPFVIALVLPTGKRPWKAPRELRELFPLPPKGAERLLPSLSYLLIDRTRMAAEALDQPSNLAAAFFRIEEARSPEDLLSLAPPLSRMLPKKGEAELRQAFTEFLLETFRRVFPGGRISDVGDLEELHMLEENLIRWRDTVIRREQRRARKEGLKEGLEEGLKKGHRKGHTEGRREGRREGLAEGKKIGEQEGKTQGQVAGMQRLLLKQMKLRFGSVSLAIRREVREISSLTELEKLAGRLLTADSLSDLGLGEP